MSTRTSSRGGGGRDDAVEFLHGWGEASGIVRSLSEGFHERNPGITVEGTSEPNVSLEVKRRILKRDAPDVWAAWVGPNMEPYQNVGVLGDATDVWTGTDMERAFHDVAKEAVRFDGAYRGVPLNVQRTNVMYYNIDLIEQAGVDPTGIDGPREFLRVLEQVDDAIDEDAFLVAFLQPFASQGLYMFESIYAGLHDPRAYRDLFSGNAAGRRDEIRESLSVFSEFFEYANDDAVNLTDGLEDERFANGEAAFRFQGMWGALGLEDAGNQYGEDWDYAPIPGTDDAYIVNMDGLLLPANPPHPESAKAFLEYAGSAHGIESFNSHKQSIPPRTDIPMDDFTGFVQDLTREFQRVDDHIPSIAHGFAVPPEVLVDLEVPFSTFISDRDVGATADELVSVLSGL